MSVLRPKIIKIRASHSEYSDLIARSAKPRLAEWMREYCLGAKVPRSNTPPPVNPDLLRQLSGLGNNLNQIARAIHCQDWRPVDRIQVMAALTSIHRELVSLKLEHTCGDC